MNGVYIVLALVAALSLFNFVALGKMRHIVCVIIRLQMIHEEEIQKLQKGNDK